MTKGVPYLEKGKRDVSNLFKRKPVNEITEPLQGK
jgi:hypothetical protein